MIIKCNNEKVKLSSLKVNEDTDSILWEKLQLCEAANTGIEFIWTDETIEIDLKNIKAPFKIVSSLILSLETDIVLQLPKDYSLLITSHHSNLHNKGPIPIMSNIECDWWPKPLKFYFSTTNLRFEKSVPYAQGIVVKREKCQLVKEDIEDWVGNENRFATRDDNAYEVLSVINQRGMLPVKPKIFRRINETAKNPTNAS